MAFPRARDWAWHGSATLRACHLVRVLADRFILNNNLIVFPCATLGPLGFSDPQKKRVDGRIEILARLREECRQSDHRFDAVISAYAGYLLDRDAWTTAPQVGFSFAFAGWIWTPPANTFEPVLAAAK